MKTQYFDLSHTIEDGIITYKGLPAPVVCDYLSREKSRELYEAGTEFQIGKIEMVTNTGTYVDCPFHRYADGKDWSDIPLERLVDLEAIVVRADYRKTQAIDVPFFAGIDVQGKAVLINTNWSDFWNTEKYFEDHPFLTREAAEFLKEAGALLVGIDSHNIDDTRSNSRPAHSILLGNEILIAEHLCGVKNLPENGFKFTAIPPKFKGVGTFPVRAFAKIES
jgi:kynurenine formamidase